MNVHDLHRAWPRSFFCVTYIAASMEKKNIFVRVRVFSFSVLQNNFLFCVVSFSWSVLCRVFAVLSFVYSSLFARRRFDISFHLVGYLIQCELPVLYKMFPGFKDHEKLSIWLCFFWRPKKSHGSTKSLPVYFFFVLFCSSCFCDCACVLLSFLLNLFSLC